MNDPMKQLAINLCQLGGSSKPFEGTLYPGRTRRTREYLETLGLEEYGL